MLAAVLVGCTAGDASSVASASVQSAPEALSTASPLSQTTQPPPEIELPQQNLNINMLTGGERPEDMREGQRPVAVMIANNQRALPQRGVAAADVVYEMVTEGGITRLMALYADYRTLPQVGPVRSSRDQFIQFALPSKAIMAQIGSSIYAQNLLSLLDYKVVDGLTLGTTAFVFDEARAQDKLNEYCWYTDAGLLWSGMEYLDVHPTAPTEPLFWFADEAVAPGTAAWRAMLTYSDSIVVRFDYDEASGLYNKYAFDVPHVDEDGTQLAFTNLILLTCPISMKTDGFVSEFNLSQGSGFYLTAGGIRQISWTKGGPTQQLCLYDEHGDMLRVQRGKSYIGVLNENIENAVVALSRADLQATGETTGPLE